MTAPLLSVQGLAIEYATRRGSVHAVRDLSFDLSRGETLAIIGESGSGKSTLATGLIRMSPRSARVTAGKVLFEGKDGNVDVLRMDDDELRHYRWSGCALVFQAALNSFNPVLTIWDHFLDTGRAHGLRDAGRIRTMADDLLDLVHLDARRVLRAYPHELSGGMRQRVLIALALLLSPGVLILDEPTTALDILTQRAIIDLLRDLRRDLSFSLIFISHDLSLAAELADRMLTMYAGRIVEEGSVEDVFYRPRHPYTVGLLRAVPRVSGVLGSVGSIPGSPPDLIRLPQGCTYAARCWLAVDACRAADPPLLRTDGDRHAAACIRWETLREQLGSDAAVPVAAKLADAPAS
jgi:peptide/nickel transport system ATP-binding protein